MLKKLKIAGIKIGIRIVYEIGDRGWGSRDFTVADPDNNEITFSEPLRMTVREDDRT
jgi:hypothetical protein